MSDAHHSHGIESVLNEKRLFAPPPDFAANARVSSLEAYAALATQARLDPQGFWREQAQRLDWYQPFSRVLDDTNAPFYKWFDDGTLNLAANCLDRHLPTRGDARAIVWEGEPGDVRTITYRELHAEVCRAANALVSLGVAPGDRVAIYMPLIPEVIVAMLACARIGATHSVIFGGFAAEAIRDRVNDAGCKLIITADGGWRRGKVLPLKANVDAALAHGCPTIEKVLVVERVGRALGGPLPFTVGRDVMWKDLVPFQSAVHSPVALPAEHPLFILYTSGTTGKPKGVVHSTGGYGVGVAYTTAMVFDLRDEDLHFCTADVGWVTGHSYIVYGPLLNGGSVLCYEGAPDFPDKDRFWSLIARHKPTIFYTAPTAIRAFMRWGNDYPKKHNLSSLRLLGSVGEPINPEAWMWYREHIGGNRCPVVDTWWQTETGAILISPLPGATPARPGSCTLPLPGIDAAVVDKHGVECGPNVGGYLVLRRPWPSIMRTIWGDPERFQKAYYSEIAIDGKPVYFAGDGARRDDLGYFWVMGRVDDVLNVAGHRLGTAEVESALVGNPAVAEAAVVGRPDELKGQAVVAFVLVKAGVATSPELGETLRAHVAHEIGAIARPDEIRFVEALPKTRSGKIMRRLLKEIAATGKATGDVTTLEDANILNQLSTSDEE